MGILKILLGVDTSELEKELNGIGKVAKAGLGALSGAVTAVAGAMTYATSVGMEYETSLAKVSTIADTSAMSLEALSDGVMNMSSKYGIASADLNEALYNTMSAGVDTAHSIEFLDQAVKLAEGGFTDTTSAVDLLTTIINAYGMEATDVTKVSDMLIQTQNKGKTTIGELASAMGKVIPTANAYGVGLEQVTSAYAIMTANGIATAESTTYLNGMLNELGKSGQKASDNLKDATGKSFQELISEGYNLGEILAMLSDYAEKSGLSLGDMFGSAEAGKSALVIASKGVDEFNTQIQGMINSTGATEQAFEKMDDTTEKSLEKMKNSMKNMGITAYQTFSGTLKGAFNTAKNTFDDMEKSFKSGKLHDSIQKLGKAVGDLIKKLSSMVKDTLPKMIDFVANLIDALPTIVKVLKTMAPAILGVVTAMKSYKIAMAVAKVAQDAFNVSAMANPFALLTSAIVGVVVALGSLTAMQIASVNHTYELDEATQSLIDSANEEKEVLASMDEENERQINLADETISKTEATWKELKTLTEKTDDLTESEKERGQYLLGELNNALGTEYKWEELIGEKHEEVTKAIEKEMQVKRANAYLDVYKDDYNHAIEMRKQYAEQTKASEEAYEKEKDVYEARKRIVEAYNQALKTYQGDGNKASQAVGEQYRIEASQVLEYVNTLKDQEADVEELYNAWQEHQKQWAEANQKVGTFETAELQISQGDYEGAIATLEAFGNTFVTASQLAERGANNIKGTLEKQYTEANDLYKYYKSTFDKLAPTMDEATKTAWEQQINSVKEQKDKALEELEKYEGDYGDKMGDVGEEGNKEFVKKSNEQSGAVKTSAQNLADDYASSYLKAIIDKAPAIASAIRSVFAPPVASVTGGGVVENTYNYNTYNTNTGNHTSVLELDGEVVYQTTQRYGSTHGTNLSR